jgi:hypothetical protein
MYLFLHEVMHTIVRGAGDLDWLLAREMEINIRLGEVPSQAVSRFFNSKCKEK